MIDKDKGGLLAKVIGPKRRWRAYKAQVKQLPPAYRTAVEAIERYLMLFAPADGDSAASMFEDLADLFEVAAADGRPIRTIVGDDPAAFAEEFARNYSDGGYVPTRARQRLIDSISRAQEDSAR